MAKESISLEGDPKQVVTRFAPNPNGPLTIGHARGVIVNHYLAKKYCGKFILRFDDTDPRTKKPLPQAYDWIIEDCRWLGCEPDEQVKASDNIPLYYEYCERLLKDVNAYVCTCQQKAFKTMKDQRRACPCRDLTAEENLKRWEKMKSEYGEGEAVVRIKTDIAHPDPALRDFVAFRVIDEPHPLTGEKYRVWPLLDFESAIEDHIRGLTHIIRGIDLLDSGLKQKYIYDYLGWDYPKVIHWGRLKIEGLGKFSSSQIAQDIASGRYSGWDDPQLPTLRAYRRRGLQPEALNEFMLGLGLSESAVNISMDNIYSVNRSLLDENTNRYFFIPEPVKLQVEGIPGKTVRMPLHPSFKHRGTRDWCMQRGSCMYISSDERLKEGEIVKLMGLPCIEVDEVGEDTVKAHYVPGKHRKTQKIQCIQEFLSCEVRKPDGSVDVGFCEPPAGNLQVGDIVQFERYGFCRLDSKKDKLTFVYGHR